MVVVDVCAVALPTNSTLAVNIVETESTDFRITRENGDFCISMYCPIERDRWANRAVRGVRGEVRFRRAREARVREREHQDFLEVPARESVKGQGQPERAGPKRAVIVMNSCHSDDRIVGSVSLTCTRRCGVLRWCKMFLNPKTHSGRMIFHRDFLGTPLWLVLLVLCCVASPASAATWTVRSQPDHLVNGGPVLFRVKASAQLESLSGKWLGHEIAFSFDAPSKTWFALAGVSFETVPGKYALEVTGSRKSGGDPLAFTQKFTVSAADYPKIRAQLTVGGKFTEPTPEQLKEIEADQKVKEDYLSRVTAEREWDGNFIAPAHAEISDVYGSQRIFNGKAQRPHYGLDFRVPTGTPVSAMNKGTVLLARPLYFEGNCVVIDHGQGLLTLYLHLSEIQVKEGENVTRGEEIGLSGGTGRATGPHLHVAVRWQGTYLDPGRLLQLQLP